MKYFIFTAILLLLQFYLDNEIYAFGGKKPEEEKTTINQTTTPNDPKINRCICPMVYMPVCGEDKNTYSNSCQASCAKVKVQSVGECPETK